MTNPNSDPETIARVQELSTKLAEALAEVERLNRIINSPQSGDFMRAVSTETEHQRQRSERNRDPKKDPSDWFWLVGYLASKALNAHTSGDMGKAEHHIITTAAACASWHRAMFGTAEVRPAGQSPS